MGWLRKKADPISDRARALNQQIAQLEAQIKDLDGELARKQARPGVRSNGVDEGIATTRGQPTSLASRPPAPRVPEAPIFEEVDLGRLRARGDSPSTPEHYNELGVRKYDLPALFRRIRNHFRGPATTNPKLVSYLAAGGIQGLRPLRYEKRVARNRFIVLVAILFVILLGLLTVYMRHN
jgi:cell division protein FtsB